MAEGVSPALTEQTHSHGDNETSTFLNWLQQSGVNEKTIEILTSEGFVDRTLFSLLSVQDIPSLNIKQLAQRKLLEKLLKNTEVPPADNTNISNEISAIANKDQGPIGEKVYISGDENHHRKEKIVKAVSPEEWTQSFRNLLTLLGLDQYYPQKISLQHVQCPPSLELHESPRNLPWEILQRLLMADNKARDIPVDKLNKLGKPKGNRFGLTQNSNLNKSDSKCSQLHPSDILIAILMCCDLLLRQVLFQKMYLCSIAVPFIIPKGADFHELMLWSLKTIVMEFCTETQESVEINPVTSKLNIVSFVRLGDLKQSKSELINKMMAGRQTFFNKMCPSGRVKRKISQGVVEASWFLPNTQNDNRCTLPMMFLNLRGDAADKQHHVVREYLCKISSAIVVLTSFENVSHESEVLQEITEKSRLLIPVLLMNEGSKGSLELAKVKLHSTHLLRCVDNVLSGYDSDTDEDTNASELQSDVHDSLQRLLTKPEVTLESLVDKVGTFSVYPDEDSEVCRESKDMYSFCSSGMDGMSAIEIKQTLPLQGYPLRKLTHCYRMQHKTYADNGNIVNMDAKAWSETTEEIDRLHAEQRDLYNKNAKSLVRNIITVINSRPHVKMFLQRLKIMLDEKSRKELPKLSQHYHQVWNEMKKLKGNPNKSLTDEEQHIKSQLLETEKKLANASLGMEHVFREICQVYESHFDCTTSVEYVPEEVADLPKLYAKEMLSGLPLEIMNGDNSSVPLVWLKAVFTKLKQLLGESKLFILGVLGVQSSGKSTLLNHMFGLQFAVSAGRCTRGVFAQMIKAPSGYGYDWILVVDTEGLRAPELVHYSFDHDNELATFVMGLSDVSIVNLKGENTAEMKDVLQTAVHAFIKLSAASRNMIAQKRCIFVHQNVPSASANDKMRYSEVQLQNTLDEMTEMAADMEHIFDIKSFNQVIQFDPDFHIWKFPDLWEGEPPMTSVNPAYIEKVKMVKSCVMDRISVNVSPLCGVEDLYTRIQDLWKGICALDFVFAFRNTLEVKAYDILEEKFSETLLTADESLHLWYNQEGRNSIYKCKSEVEIKQASDKIMTALDEKLEKEQTSKWNLLKQYLKVNKFWEVIKQWMGGKERNFNKASQTLRQDIVKCLKNDANIQKVEAEVLNKQSSFMLKVNKAAEDAAKQMSADSPSSTDAKSPELFSKLFNSFWDRFFAESEMKMFYTPDDMDLNEIFYDILANVLYKHSHLLKSELTRQSLGPLGHIMTSSWKLNENFMEASDLYKESKMLGGSKIDILSEAYSKITSVISDARDFLDNIIKTARPFNKIDAHSFVLRVIESFDEINRNLSGTFHFTLLPSLKVKLCAHVCRCAIPLLQEKQRQYDLKYGMTAKLNACKETTLKTFLNCVSAKKDEIVAAEYICSSMKASIKRAVEHIMPIEMKKAFLRHFGYTKFLLMTTVLEHIAKQNEFDEIIHYTDDPEKYSRKWFISKCEEIMFQSRGTETSLFMETAKIALTDVKEKIKLVFQQTCREVIDGNSDRHKTQEWVNIFNSNIVSNIVLQDDLSFVTTKNIMDFKSFECELKKKLFEVEADLMKTFGEVTAQTVQWMNEPPYTEVFEKLWGCKSVCPFCKEPCLDTDPDHYQGVGEGMPHRAMQHRPQGITGWRYIQTQDIVCFTCANNVAARGHFRCSMVCVDRGTCTSVKEDFDHPYEEYKDIFPSWDIEPSTRLDDSKYWMWVIDTHKYRLKDHFKLEIETIPKDWRHVNKEQAVVSLRKTYRLS